MNPPENGRPRTFNTEIRKPWNSIIHQSLKAIDLHTRFYIETGDSWHLEKAQTLREYVTSLKNRIISLEGKSSSRHYGEIHLDTKIEKS